MISFLPLLSFHSLPIPLHFFFTYVFCHLFHLGKAVKLGSGSSHNHPNSLSAHLGTGVRRPSIAEVPRSPISSSVPPAGRNTTLSRTRGPPHSTRNSVRPLSPSKTFTSSHSSSTPGGNGVITSLPFSHSLFPSSYLRLSSPVSTLSRLSSSAAVHLQKKTNKLMALDFSTQFAFECIQ